jgi:hypothetical protein
LFATTFDLASQVLARRLNSVLRSHVPRANAGVVIVEPPKYAVFAEAFRTNLGLAYPVAMADAATISGDGPFGKLEGVPLTVVLDAEGRTVFRKFGVVTDAEMRRALKAAR